MIKYIYSYVYDTCCSLWIGTNKVGVGIYGGNGRVVFFQCEADDILQADKKLANFCELNKINWSQHPFTQVVCEIQVTA